MSSGLQSPPSLSLIPVHVPQPGAWHLFLAQGAVSFNPASEKTSRSWVFWLLTGDEVNFCFAQTVITGTLLPDI